MMAGTQAALFYKIQKRKERENSVEILHYECILMLELNCEECQITCILCITVVFVAARDEVKLLSYPCKHCNMKFAQIRGLKVHIRHNHLKLSM
jgi:hypothetical protein